MTYARDPSTPPRGPDRRARVRSGSLALLLAGLLAGPLAGPGVAHAQEGSDAVPAPASFLGFEPGADYRLADYDQIRGYFEALAASTDRLRLEEIGTTVQGRPMLLAVISSAENLENVERYREISRRLAMARDLGEEEARELAREGKAIVWIDAGLHATEVAHAQHGPLFAHHMVTGEDPEVRKIREESIVLYMPVMNPDGLDIVVDWYRRNLGTEFETSPLPVLYHEYVGHDNNRDWFMNLMPETRAVTHQLWFEWFPQIVYNHHQAGDPPPTIFIPPFADPMNPNIPPQVMRGINLVGAAMGQRYAEEEKPGVVSRETYTAWWNGGMRTAPYFHNQVGILTETYHHAYATPRYFEPDSLPDRFGSGRSTRRPSVFYPNPWEGGWWRLSDQVAYEMTGSMAVADIGAELKETWLHGVYRMGRRAIEKGEAGGPFAYVVPAGQWDAGAAAEMVTALRRGGVEVHRATGAFRAGDREFAAGSYVAHAAQPFRAHLMDMLEPQLYPDRRAYPGGPPVTPYDLAGWTLPMQMGVEAVRVDEPFRAPAAPVEEKEVEPPAGEVTGSGPVHLLTPRRNDSFSAVNRLQADGVRVERATGSFEAGGRSWPAGTFLVWAGRDRLEPLARDLGLDFAGVGEPDVEAVRVHRPRIGLYRSWVANMDEGWTRWILEGFDFRFETLEDADIRAGDLSRFDVILLPEQDAEEILKGHEDGTMPEEYTGGLGPRGAAALADFVERGGTLVALDHASEFAAAQLGLPVRNAVGGLEEEEFFIPGSLVRMRVDPEDPLGWGMREEAAAYFVRSLAFEVVPAAGEPEGAEGPKRGDRRVDVAARYGEEDLLMSGWELGADRHLAGLPAVVRLPYGEGQVVLTAFRPQFRAQPRGTFKILFNALLASTTEDLPFDTTGG